MDASALFLGVLTVVSALRVTSRATACVAATARATADALDTTPLGTDDIADGEGEDGQDDGTYEKIDHESDSFAETPAPW